MNMAFVEGVKCSTIIFLTLLCVNSTLHFLQTAQPECNLHIYALKSVWYKSMRFGTHRYIPGIMSFVMSQRMTSHKWSHPSNQPTAVKPHRRGQRLMLFFHKEHIGEDRKFRMLHVVWLVCVPSIIHLQLYKSYKHNEACPFCKDTPTAFEQHRVRQCVSSHCLHNRKMNYTWCPDGNSGSGNMQLQWTLLICPYQNCTFHFKRNTKAHAAVTHHRTCTQ